MTGLAQRTHRPEQRRIGRRSDAPGVGMGKGGGSLPSGARQVPTCSQARGNPPLAASHARSLAKPRRCPRRGALGMALGLLAVLLSLAAPLSAQAAFGLNHFDVRFANEDGTPATQAGSHPFSFTTAFGLNASGELPDGEIRDIFAELPRGFVADATAYPQCSTADFLTEGPAGPVCPLDTVVGIDASAFGVPGNWASAGVFNLVPPPGVLLRLGFNVLNGPDIVIDGGLSHTPPYRARAETRNAPQIYDVFANKLQLWGDPSDPAHDGLRGYCGLRSAVLGTNDLEAFQFENVSGETCPVQQRSRPLLTLPTECEEPGLSNYEALSWEGLLDAGSALTHDAGGNPIPFSGCGALGFAPSIEAKPTSRAAESPTGLDLSVDVADEGLTSVDGLSQSDISDVLIALPEGMTANPSVAEGLEVCSEEQLAAETLDSPPGAGCPQASKIGTVRVESPLVSQPIDGALYQATPHENLADDSLIAFYFVLKNPELGVIVKQAARVEPDPETGQLIGISEEVPQLPFSHFRLHFREGGRSPLISPPRCGVYDGHDAAHEPVVALIFPWSGGPPVQSTSSFEIVSGPDGGECPKGGIPPFHPSFEAGSVNNSAGRYSPFNMRLARKDGEQEMTKFSSVLPPGVLGKLAGVSRCSDAQIARAKAKTGRQELAVPSCPANSRIGRTVGGAGVGSQLTFIDGSLYLAGPYKRDPLSVVAITPAVAGPFDVGTVVVRVALTLNPRTGEVEVDGSKSDPIPHILAGIPLNVRLLDVEVDRPEFTLNPTSCEESSTRATLFGSYLKILDPLDDVPVSLADRYQAASCASLGFKPQLTLKLKGGTKRGGHPALRAVARPRKGDANIEDTVVRLPRSAFLDQGHIRTICTRVQFAADACPQGAVYGHVRAFTPLLSEPLEGPAILRSSNHKLPDLVFDLHGIVDIEASARIDSVRGGIRATFADVPDAPIEKVVVNMQGARKGLIVNSTNLCAQKHRADVKLTAHNGRRSLIRPVVGAGCGGGGGRASGR
jgi:hypothetical protein